jgi:hypothetical protein
MTSLTFWALATFALCWLCISTRSPLLRFYVYLKVRSDMRLWHANYRRRMIMEEDRLMPDSVIDCIDYVAFLRFDSDSSDQFMAKVIVHAKIEKASLGVGLKSGISEFDFSLESDEDAFAVVNLLVMETGGVEIIGVYRASEIDSEEIRVSEKRNG